MLDFCSYAERFLSTPSARRATFPEQSGGPECCISIHALREEGDFIRHSESPLQINFYPRPPRGGRHPVNPPILEWRKISIHALREEGDMGVLDEARRKRHFYPRPPRGGRLRKRTTHFLSHDISIHALREEGDDPDVISGKAILVFLSTPSARRATRKPITTSGQMWNFYPRPPRGGRPRPLICPTVSTPFLSTPSARRATMRWQAPPGTALNFYPRPPRGGRPNGKASDATDELAFLSTPSARRAT